MSEWDAGEQSELLVSEHEILFCLRDLLRLYMEQQTSIYGRTTPELAAILALVEDRVDAVEEELNCKIEQVQ